MIPVLRNSIPGPLSERDKLWSGVIQVLFISTSSGTFGGEFMASAQVKMSNTSTYSVNMDNIFYVGNMCIFAKSLASNNFIYFFSSSYTCILTSFNNLCRVLTVFCKKAYNNIAEKVKSA